MGGKFEVGSRRPFKVGAVVLPGGVRVDSVAGAPTNGTSGTLATRAPKGSLLIDRTNGTVYQNTNTKASPTWTVIAGAGSITKADLGYTAVTVTVAAGAATGSSAAAAALVGGEILGYYPTTNQDQGVDTVTLNGDGSVTITLRANATADNVFKVVVLKP